MGVFITFVDFKSGRANVGVFINFSRKLSMNNSFLDENDSLIDYPNKMRKIQDISSSI